MGGVLMGRILIGGTASLLICIFLSPKFIEFLRRREFGQQIREDGPQGHHAEGRHADDGRRDPLRRGLGAVPGPDRLRMALGRGVRRRDRVRAARLRRRLHQAGQAPLAGPARPAGSCAVTIAISLGALVHRRPRGRSWHRTLHLRIGDCQIDLGPFYPVLIYLVIAGTSNGVNLTDGLDGLAAG